MIDTSDSIKIHRPVDEVFRYVTGTTNDPAWHTDILEAQKTSEGPIGVGTTWHMHFKPAMGFGRRFGGDRLRAQPGGTLRGAMGPMHPTLTYRFEPTDGGTVFTRHVQINVTGFMKAPLMRRMVPKNNAGFVTNLKRVLEEFPAPN